VRTIMMMENYRSTPEILDCANSLIDKNDDRMKKELKAMNEPGRKVVYKHAKNALEEAEWMRDEIKGLVKQGVSYGDIAILVPCTLCNTAD
jgi:DNA helicase-2/ATP-dependent DNA helicase PcrA